MLSASRIERLFRALDAELAHSGIVGEVLICGGAVMCLVYQAREATKDVDAIFEPTEQIRQAAARVAERVGVAADWLNDAAKGFLSGDPPRQAVLHLPNLRVWAPNEDYMLAMKCVAARLDSQDRDDVAFLIGRLGLSTPDEVFDVIARFYPRHVVPARTQFLVEELLEQMA